ncbi:oligosaccharide flippase family protein [Bradyrhizobium sp. UFLA05-153]
MAAAPEGFSQQFINLIFQSQGAMASRQFINIAANFVGVGASVALPLIFNVAYYRYLGGENYGLIGFYGSLLLLAYLLDMGLTQTTVRELARRAADPERAGEMRLVVFTLQCIYGAVGLTLGLLVVLSSHWLAENWLKLDQLPTAEASSAIARMGAMLGLSFPSILFSAVLRGLQRQVLSNALTIVVAVLRGILVLACLTLFGATSRTFFTTQVCISVGELGILATVAWLLLPPSSTNTHFNFDFLKSIWRFTSTNGLAVLIGHLMMLSDRIILSTFLPLKVFGIYTLSVTAASMVTKLSGPFSNAYFPHFVELAEQGRHESLSESYHTATQLASAVIISTGIILMFYARDAIFLLTNDPMNAAVVAPALTLFAAANTLNALMWLPHTLQLAAGVAKYTLRINIAQAVMYLPALLLLVPRYGIYAPPALWLIVNAVNLPIFITQTHKTALHGEAWEWVKHAMMAPSISIVTVVGIGTLLAPTTVSWLITLPWLSANFGLAIAVSGLVTPKARQLIRLQLSRLSA